MKNKLTNNLGLKIVSLFVAASLWLIVNNINDPTIDRSFSNIPVKLLNTELITDSGQVYEIVDNTAVISNVTIWAPRSVFNSITAANIVATADVSELSSLDTISIKLSTNLYNNKIERIKASNDTVKLNIEEKKSKTLALKATTSGTIENGYLIGDITTDQNLVRISGPESLVEQVSKAIVDVPVTGFTSNISDNAEIRLYDAEDRLIEDSRIEQNIKTVGVQVAIYKINEVSLFFNYSGMPASGYRVSGGVQSGKETVMLAGKESILKNITAIEIPADAIDISGRSETYEEMVDIRSYLPEGTFLANSSDAKIAVMVVILPEVTREVTVYGSRVEVSNIPDGYRATISELDDTFAIEVSGLQTDVAALRSADIRGTVDISAWMTSQNMETPVEGYYQVEVDFGLSDNITVLEPVMVTMHLSKMEEE